MNVHDIDEEEEITAGAIASGEDASRFDERPSPRSGEGDDPLALFLGTSGDTEGDTEQASSGANELPPPKSLFENDLRYCEAALHYLDWIQDTMTTEREPWLRLICAMVGEGDGQAIYMVNIHRIRYGHRALSATGVKLCPDRHER